MQFFVMHYKLFRLTKSFLKKYFINSQFKHWLMYVYIKYAFEFEFQISLDKSIYNLDLNMCLYLHKYTVHIMKIKMFMDYLMFAKERQHLYSYTSRNNASLNYDNLLFI